MGRIFSAASALLQQQILEVSILSFFCNKAGDKFLCNFYIAASAYELLVTLSYIIRFLGIPLQTDDDDGRTTDDDDHLSYSL